MNPHVEQVRIDADSSKPQINSHKSDLLIYAFLLALTILWTLFMPAREIASLADLRLLPSWSEALQITLTMLTAVSGLGFALRNGYSGTGSILITVAMVLSAVVFRSL